MNCLSSSEIAGPDQAIHPSRFEESALLLARQQRFTVVQLTHEIHPGLGGLERVHHLKTGARHPTWDIQPVEDVIGHEVCDGGPIVGRNAHRQSRQGVHRGAERHDAGDVLGTPIRGGLIAEHAPLRIPDDVHVAAGGVLDRVDDFTERHDMVGEVAAHAALDFVG